MTDDWIDEGREALTDEGTELPNRLHFDVVFRMAFAAGARGFPITVLILEVPAIEDADPEGLKDLARRLSAVTRRMDLVARLDDTCFAGLLLDCNVHGGHIAAERVLSALMPWLARRDAVVNIGVAAFDQEMQTRQHLMEAARRALEAARAHPGNAIETAG